MIYVIIFIILVFLSAFFSGTETAYFHIRQHRDDIPEKVSIVEGVEIAKIYGNDESSAFINGVLDSIYNDLKDNRKQ